MRKSTFLFVRDTLTHVPKEEVISALELSHRSEPVSSGHKHSRLRSDHATGNITRVSEPGASIRVGKY